jgi:hypothetical protein
MLRNRKEVEEIHLKGVIRDGSVDASKVKLGAFPALTNMTVKEVGSIQRKRGVSPLNGIDAGEFAINLQDNFLRDDCNNFTFVGSCVDCLTFSPGDDGIIAKSASGGTPCFCFYAPQICFNGVISVSLEYVSDLAGNGISGVTLAVPPDATDILFSGYGLVYTPGTLTLAEWTSASLATIETTLDTAALTLNPGDVIKLTYNTSTGDLKGYVNDIEQVSVINEFTLNNVNNKGAGIVVVGNTGSDDRATWTNLNAFCTPSVLGNSIICCDCDDLTFFNIQCCSDNSNPSCSSADCTTEPGILRACGGRGPYTWSVTGPASIVQLQNSICARLVHNGLHTPELTCPAYIKHQVQLIDGGSAGTCSGGPHNGEGRSNLSGGATTFFYNCAQTLIGSSSCACSDCFNIGSGDNYLLTYEACTGPFSDSANATLASFTTNLAITSQLGSAFFTQTFRTLSTCFETDGITLSQTGPGVQLSDFIKLCSDEAIASLCVSGCDTSAVTVKCTDADGIEAFFFA